MYILCQNHDTIFFDHKFDFHKIQWGTIIKKLWIYFVFSSVQNFLHISTYFGMSTCHEFADIQVLVKKLQSKSAISIRKKQDIFSWEFETE